MFNDVAFFADEYLPGVVVTSEDARDVNFSLWQGFVGKVGIGTGAYDELV